MVLRDEEGRLYEGLSSNFYVVTADPEHGDTVVTAPEGAVLRGTIQATVLRLCMQAGLRTAFDFPRLAEAATWRGAFLTSTSRLVLPVARLRVAPGGPVVRIPLHPKVERLRQLVLDDLRAHSTAMW